VWQIDSLHVESTLTGKHPVDISPFADSPLAVSRIDPANALSAPQATNALRDPHIRVEIPSDIHIVRDASPAIAVEWRQATRHAFQYYLAASHRVAGFYRDKQTDRCFYCLEPRR
jgi:predicted GNAT superfamily acetyltransferase